MDTIEEILKRGYFRSGEPIRFSESRMGRRHPDYPNSWQDLPWGEFEIKRPCVIYFSGNGTVTTEGAGGLGKLIANLMGMYSEPRDVWAGFDDVDLIGFAYCDERGKGKGCILDEEMDSLIDKMFVPLLVDGRGNLLPKERICRNLSNITFFSYCHGAIEVSNIVRGIESKLLKYGMEYQDIRDIINEMRHISYASLGRQEFVPSIKAFSFFDGNYEDLGDMYEDVYDERLDGISIKYDGANTTMGLPNKYAPSQSIKIYSSRMFNNSLFDEENAINEHPITTIKRDDKWQISPYFDMYGIMKQAKNADAVSMMLGYALADSVATSLRNMDSSDYIPKTPLLELLPQLESIRDTYNEEELARS